MAGPELTPELLAQLEAIDGQPYNCEWREEYVQDRNESTICDAREEKEAAMIICALNALPALVAAAREFAAWRDEEAHDVMRLNAAMLKAEEERDQLRADVERLEGIAHEFDLASTRADALLVEVGQLRERQQVHLQQIAKLSQSTPLAEELAGWEGQRAKLIAEVGTLRAELATLKERSGAIRWDSTADVLMADYGRRTVRQLHDRYIESLSLESDNDKLRAELDDVRRAVDAPGDSGTFEAVARLHDEVTRLRGAAGECLTLLEAMDDGETWSRSGAAMHLTRLRAEIERKP